jgi:hypothetical protein
MSRRLLRILSVTDSARLAVRFPVAAATLMRDCIGARRPASFPRRIGVFLTNRCNFACPMCAVQEVRGLLLARGGDLPFDLVDQVLKECSPHQPVIDFLGGEPLLYPELARAVALAADRRALAVVTTNGLTLAGHAESLVRARLPMLQVSLDGWDEDSQRSRGGVKGSFARLGEGVRAVQAARGGHPFPIIRILTAITRNNYFGLDRIQSVIAELGVRYWGIANYFHLNRHAAERHRTFALVHRLTGVAPSDTIGEDVYLQPSQVDELAASLHRVREQNKVLRLHIAYAWDIDLAAYYSTRAPASFCDLPYSRLDIHTDGHMAICVSGHRIGQAGRDTIAGAWTGGVVESYRRLYERTGPMPMCFRCCGLSQTISFDTRR